jgi:beta-glucanase (GH16 family)
MVMRKIFTLAALSAAVTATSALAAEPYSGAELYSHGSNGQFKYGRFEARMQMVSSPGTVSSMFLYYDNSYLGGGEPWEEIDIEVLGKDATKFQSNILSNSKENQNSSEGFHTVNPATNAGYHTYTIVWTPEYVSWELDGVEVRRDVSGVNKSKQGLEQVNTLVHDESLRFNLWLSGSPGWTGDYNQCSFPQYQYINWIKVYSYNPQTKQFTLKWKDSFDTFNSSIWAKGNWDMEKVTHSTSNVNIVNGYLVLSLTRAGQEGAPSYVPQDPNPELYDQDIGGPASSQSSNPSSSQSFNPGSSSSAFGPTYGSSDSQNPYNPEALVAGVEHPFSLSMQKDGFTVNGAVEGASWVVYDLNGMVLLKGSLPGKASSQFVSTRNLPRGAYLLKVGRNGYSQSFRFVKP